MTCGAWSMLPRRLNKLWLSLARRLVAGFALIAYLLVSVGAPLPARPPKDRSQPFPCQDHACGCQSAADCWQHCCCFSPEQRQAWAQAHDVVPPVPKIGRASCRERGEIAGGAGLVR